MQKLRKKQPVQEVPAVEEQQQELAPKELPVPAKKSNKELIALGLLSTIPSIIGAVAGGSEGGEAGANASLTGLKQMQEEQKQGREQQQVLQKAALESQERKAKQQADAELKRELQEERLAAQKDLKTLVAGNQQPKQTEAQKVFERAAAKTIEPYISGGRDLLQANAEKLIESADKLTKLKDSSTAKRAALGLIGESGRSLVTPERKEIENAINSVTVEQLRQTLGAQFTATENKQFRELQYDPKLPESTNAKNARKKAELILKKIQETDQRVNQFSETGSLLPQPISKQKSLEEMTDEELDAREQELLKKLGQ